MTTEEELEQLRQENRALREVKQELREGLGQAIQAIESLQERVQELEELRRENSALRAEGTRLQEQLRALQEQLAKNSRTSSRPPSADHFHRQPKSLRKKSGKKPGGQAGHPGHHLSLVDTPDHLEVYPVHHCASCQHDLRTQPALLPERRQVIDLPVKRVLISEHRVEEKHCPACQHVTRAAFPTQVNAPVQYGASIHALAVYLVQYQLLPYARVSEMLSDLLGVCLSPGTVQTLVQQCYQQLADVEQQIKTALQQAP